MTLTDPDELVDDDDPPLLDPPDDDPPDDELPDGAGHPVLKKSFLSASLLLTSPASFFPPALTYSSILLAIVLLDLVPEAVN